MQPRGMKPLLHPPTRANVAAASGEWLALFDCLECANGVYIPGAASACSCCGAAAPEAIQRLMNVANSRRPAA